MKYLVFVMAFLLVGCASIPKHSYLDLSPAIANTNNAVKQLDVALQQKTVALKNQAIKVAQNDINRIRQCIRRPGNTPPADAAATRRSGAVHMQGAS